MRIELTQDIIDAIKKLMYDKKMTQTEVADLMGVTNASVSNILTGKTKAIRDVHLSALEPYINKYRDPRKFTSEAKLEINKLNSFDPSDVKWHVSIVDHIKKYKEVKNLSYDDLSQKYGIPVLKLAQLLETDYGDAEHFDITNVEDIPAIIAMSLSISSEFFNGDV